MLKPFGLSQRLVLASIILSLSIAAVMALLLRRFEGLIDSTHHLERTDQVLLVGSQLQEDLLDLFQTQEIFNQFLYEQTWQHYLEFSGRVKTFLDNMKELRQGRKKTGAMDALNKARMEMSELLSNATYTINPNFPIGAVSTEMLKKIRLSRDRLHQQIRNLMLQERTQRFKMEALLREQVVSLKNTLALIVILIMLGGLLFALYLHRSTMAPLRGLMEVMQKTNEGLPSPPLPPSGAQEMRDLIDSFNQMNLELFRHQKKLRSMLSLAVTVAHEVRNPITAIGTAIQALQPILPPDSPDHEIFREILKEVYRVDAIISDLLVFAKPRPLSPEEFSIKEFFEELRILLKPYLDRNKITLDIRIAPNISSIVADRNQLHRIFLNLINNSIDALEAGDGTIFLVAESLLADRIQFIIEDSGPGVPEEFREKIFEPFFSRKTKGTGLGLAIVIDILDRHGGKILVEKGKTHPGARFVVDLPVKGIDFQNSSSYENTLSPIEKGLSG